MISSKTVWASGSLAINKEVYKNGKADNDNYRLFVLPKFFSPCKYLRWQNEAITIPGL